MPRGPQGAGPQGHLLGAQMRAVVGRLQNRCCLCIASTGARTAPSTTRKAGDCKAPLIQPPILQGTNRRHRDGQGCQTTVPWDLTVSP